MLVGERDEPGERAVVEPCVRVQQQDVAPGRLRDAPVPAGGEPAIRLLDDLPRGNALADERDSPVARLVVDDDGLGPGHALEASLEPRQRVVRDDHHRRVAHLRRSASTATIAAPGSASAIVTTKKRKPVANAGSAATPSSPRNDTKNDSRTASPLTVKGTSATRNSSGPIT